MTKKNVSAITVADLPRDLVKVAGETAQAREKRAREVSTLEATQRVAKEELARLKDTLSDDARATGDRADQSFFAVNDLTIGPILQNKEAEIASLDVAIERVRSGVREKVKCACGKVIPKARLEIFPNATHCVPCQEKVDNRKNNARLPTASIYEPPRNKTKPRY